MINGMFRIIIILILVILIIVAVLVSFSDIFNKLFVDVPFGVITLIAILFGALIAFISFQVLNIWMKEFSLPRSYYVAIVGFPKSGKTTLISSLFGEAFKGNFLYKFEPRGKQTIETINKNLLSLSQGIAIGPTKDQERFAFRADIRVKKFPPMVYRTEFGDFRGDDSKDFSEKYGDWLHNTEFFKWVIDSDAIIFIVDLGDYLKSDINRRIFINKMTSSIRAAWQNFIDSNISRKSEIKKHPIILTFTKSDLFGIDPNSYTIPEYEKVIAKLGFGEKTPELAEINEILLEKGISKALTDFSDLISYFTNEVPNFNVNFCSCFGTIKGKRYGLEDILQKVFTKR